MGRKPAITEAPLAQTIAYPSGKVRPRRSKAETAPHVVVLFGATGDLSRRKLLCGLGYLAASGLTGGLRVIGTSLDDFGDEEFRTFARESVDAVGARKLTDEEWERFAPMLSYVPQSAGPEALAAKVAAAEAELGDDALRLHYLSVPPQVAPAVTSVRTAGRPRVARSRTTPRTVAPPVSAPA